MRKNIESGSCEYNGSSSSSLNEENHHFCWVGQKGACLSLACQRGHVPVTATAHQWRLVGEGGGSFMANCHLSESGESERLSDSSVSGWPFTFSSPLHFVAQTFVTDTRHRFPIVDLFPLKWHRLGLGSRLWTLIQAVNFDGMLTHFIPFDSPWTVLQLCFWLQDDWVKF
jgi:hypothetical protein